MKYYSVNDLKILSDEELYMLVCQKSYELIEADHNDIYVTYKTDNLHLRQFRSIHMFESEVINGGFHQFFVNSGYDYYGEYLLKGLPKILADKFTEIFEKAVKVYLDHDQEIECEIVPEFDKLDEEFYKLNKWETGSSTLSNLQVNYVKSNYELFEGDYHE